jgi:uncharacterized SAM-binding protein YcdF (DUF218 family)
VHVDVVHFLTPSPLLALGLLCLVTRQSYRQHPPHLLRPARHCLALLTLWMWVSCTPALVNLATVALEGTAPPLHATPTSQTPFDDTDIIVLGSGEMYASSTLVSPRMDVHGWERVYAGVALWRQTGGRLIFTGGPGTDDTPTLAGLMRSVAHELGVPMAQMGIATGSLNTYQDLLSAQKLLRPQSRVWLVTSAAHMPRAMAVANKLGVIAKAYSVDYRQIRQISATSWLPNPGAIGQVLYAGHEILGRLHYWRKGWAD